MLRRRPRLRAFLRHFATSTCRRSSCIPLQPHVPDPKSLPLPPVAKKVPFTVSAHGRSWSDPYHWMRDTSDPDLAALLAAENAYADAFVGSATGGLRSRLAAEMRARLPPSAVTPPEPWGPWLYYQYVPEGMEYPVLSRKRRPSGGLAALLDFFSGSDKEQVLLDWNEFAEKNDLSYLMLIWLQVYVIESDNVRNGLWPIRKRADQVQYFLEHHNGFFYILTNAPLKDAETPTEGYYLARSRAENSLVDEWQIVMLPGSDCAIEDMDMFHDSLVLFLRKKGSHLFCSIDMPIDVDFEIPDLTVDYDMRKKTFSILHQEEVNSISASLRSAGLESNISSIQQNLLVVEKSQSWSDLSKQFSWKRFEVISHDGVPIPLLILYSPEAHQHGESPGIIYGYGAYGEDLDKSWCSERLSLLARGWVLAFADVRYVKVCWPRRYRRAIGNATVAANLTLDGVLQLPHLDNCIYERLEKSVLIMAEDLNHSTGSNIVGEERLVRVEEAAERDEVLEVLVVEDARGGVQAAGDLLIAARGTVCIERAAVDRVHVGIGPARARLVVETKDMEKQRALPMVCELESATRSVTERLRPAKRLISVVAFVRGIGLISLESFLLALRLSSQKETKTKLT
ncbi:hypothetical protein PR202_ga15537 [Eleusine coracana subsp. coracana]|uniref:Peptidase S9A N-terminal domain-containing protein n=1 Tax=Eleusine coracana subsp. coracana TaxID=191504 RepID=A0AAV5CJ89_ELECO|nr:hypothetical protein PR202_ga15537 [Eleusine coracana subsp. coracana]